MTTDTATRNVEALRGFLDAIVAVSQELGVTHEFDDGRLRRGRAYPSHAQAVAATEAPDA